MLIDINAYTGHWPFRRLRGNTCEALLERMDENGVDISVVSNVHGLFYKNTQSANEELYEEIRANDRFRNRLIPFAVINPTYPDWKHDLDICHKKFGMTGLRLYPQYHDYELSDPSCIEIVKMARDRAMPVSFAIRFIDIRQRSWIGISRELSMSNIAAVVSSVPDARYITLNTIIGRMSDDEVATIKNADIVFDTARLVGVSTGGAGSHMPTIIEKYGRDKPAFGTFTPFLDYVTPFIRIGVLEDGEVNEATKELIRSGNARRILGL